MVNNQIQRYLEFANLQMAAEAFLIRDIDNGVLPGEARLQARLVQGNFHPSRFLQEQAEQFTAQYQVLGQYRNDPLLDGRSGFSGTLFRNRSTGELTLSFRSLEFIDDAVRDGKSTSELEIKDLGWALGQIAEMETWYAQLRADPNLLGGKKFNVTGYSLGGHLATAFNILRREQYQASGETNPVLNTYTFNGAGVGDLKPGKRLTDVINTFNLLRGMADITSSLEWSALPPTDQVALNQQALERVVAINVEAARLNSPSFVATFAFDTRPSAGEQAT